MRFPLRALDFPSDPARHVRVRSPRNVSLENICLIAEGLGVAPAELLRFDALTDSQEQDDPAVG